MEEIVKSFGFESEQEFHKLNSSVDISSEEARQEYLKWRDSATPTKEKLLKLIEKYSN